jgi:hypothetical protein
LPYSLTHLLTFPPVHKSDHENAYIYGDCTRRSLHKGLHKEKSVEVCTRRSLRSLHKEKSAEGEVCKRRNRHSEKSAPRSLQKGNSAAGEVCKRRQICIWRSLQKEKSVKEKSAQGEVCRKRSLQKVKSAQERVKRSLHKEKSAKE